MGVQSETGPGPYRAANPENIPMIASLRRQLVLAAVLLPGADLACQSLQNAIVPKKYAAVGQSNAFIQEPFSKQPNRYQQTYSATELQRDIKTPVRIKGVRFRAKQSGQPGFTVTLQLAIGSYTGNASSKFDDNLKDAMVVFSRNTITLPTSAGGQFVVNLPFSQDFTWDGQSNIVIDIRVFGNGNQNKPFLYFFDGFLSDFAVGGERMWALNPVATTAGFRQTGSGMVTRFDFQEGVALNYGTGCKGQGGFVPKISANGIPVVGNTNLRVNLTQARPQTVALLFWGGSRTTWGPFTLPLDLKGLGIPGCFLLAEPLQIFTANVLGGTPGTGIASVPFGIPPSNIFRGISLYAQWGVVDDSQNRVLGLAFSDGIMLTIG